MTRAGETGRRRMVASDLFWWLVLTGLAGYAAVALGFAGLKVVQRFPSGYTAEEAATRDQWACLQRALDRLPDGTSVDVSEAGYIGQRAITLGYPRIDYAKGPESDLRITLDRRSADPVFSEVCGGVRIEFVSDGS